MKYEFSSSNGDWLKSSLPKAKCTVFIDVSIHCISPWQPAINTILPAGCQHTDTMDDYIIIIIIIKH